MYIKKISMIDIIFYFILTIFFSLYVTHFFYTYKYSSGKNHLLQIYEKEGYATISKNLTITKNIIINNPTKKEAQAVAIERSITHTCYIMANIIESIYDIPKKSSQINSLILYLAEDYDKFIYICNSKKNDENAAYKLTLVSNKVSDINIHIDNYINSGTRTLVGSWIEKSNIPNIYSLTVFIFYILLIVNLKTKSFSYKRVKQSLVISMLTLIASGLLAKALYITTLYLLAIILSLSTTFLLFIRIRK